MKTVNFYTAIDVKFLVDKLFLAESEDEAEYIKDTINGLLSSIVKERNYSIKTIQ